MRNESDFDLLARQFYDALGWATPDLLAAGFAAPYRVMRDAMEYAYGQGWRASIQEQDAHTDVVIRTADGAVAGTSRARSTPTACIKAVTVTIQNLQPLQERIRTEHCQCSQCERAIHAGRGR